MADKKKYRRSNGEGSVFKHQNGRWCGQIGLGVDENGKRLRKTVFGSTRAEVVEQLMVLQGSINYLSTFRLANQTYITPRKKSNPPYPTAGYKYLTMFEKPN